MTVFLGDSNGEQHHCNPALNNKSVYLVMSCRPEYKALKPLPHERYPENLKSGQRQKHLGWQKYQERMQSLGFYTSVHMLESAGSLRALLVCG